MIKEGADKQFQSFDLKLEKPMVNNNLSIMDEDIANKDMKDMGSSENSPKSIFKDYLEVSLYPKVEVLEVIDDDEVKLEEKECVKELQVDFIGTKNIILTMEFFLAFTLYKLNFKVHWSRTCYFMNMLATLLYLKYLFIWSGKVQFLIDNSMMIFLEVEGINRGGFLPYSWHNNVYCIISLMVKICRF